MGNALYFGDCLDVMRESISDESVDLIYLDPPFNSKRIYNASMGGAQWVAFDDTWRWSEAVDDFHEVAGDVELAPTMEGLRKILGEGSKLAYLAYMANRLRECHRALKPTGSIYLHCDPTMNYLLRVVMDAVFGDGSFHNEVIWKRTSSHNRAKRWGPVHDTILFYSLGKRFQWNRVLQPLDHSYVERFYRHKNSLGRYRVDNLTGPGPRAGDTGKPWRGVDPTENSRHWELPPDRALPDWFDYPPGYANLLARERLDVLDAQGLIYWPKRGKMPGFKRYLSGQSGAPVTDMVLDIPPLSAATRERLGYPTQKPVRLLQRIIQASSNPDDVVLDPSVDAGQPLRPRMA